MAQTIDSLHSLRLEVTGHPAEAVAFDADGYLRYVALEQQLQSGTFKRDFRSTFDEYSYRFARFEALDRERVELFEQFMSQMKAEGVKVHAFITPLHPELVRHLENQSDFKRLHELVLKYLHGVADRYANMMLCDLTDISSFSGTGEDFYDAAHVSPPNALRMTRAAWNGNAVQ